MCKELIISRTHVNVRGLIPVLADAVCNSTNQCKQAFKNEFIYGKEENHSHAPCVDLLIKAGAEVNDKVENGISPLINAASKERSW